MVLHLKRQWILFLINWSEKVLHSEHISKVTKGFSNQKQAYKTEYISFLMYCLRNFTKYYNDPLEYNLNFLQLAQGDSVKETM